MTRTYKAWTPEVCAQLCAAVAQGMSNEDIGRILGRSAAMINKQKAVLGLIIRPHICAHCGQPLQLANIGRPRRYCSKSCAGAAKTEAERIKREAEIRICAAPNCTNILPTASTRQRRYCSRLCRGRSHELTYQRPRTGAPK